MTVRQASIELAAAVPAAATDLRRNHRLGVLSGTVANVAQSFLHPELIVAGLIYALTGSKMLVALVTVLSKAGVLAPQLLLSRFIEHLPRRRPSYVLLAVGRGAALALLVAALWLLTRSADALTLTLFFVAYLLVCALTGSVYVVYLDMVGRLIPGGQVAAFLGMRHFLGGLCGILTGLLVIQPILGHVRLPHSYLLLAAMGTVLAVLNMALFSLCRESDGPRAEAPTGLAESFRRGFGYLRTNRNYRMYLWVRIAFRVNYLGLAFFIPYGKDRLTRAAGATDIVLLGGIMVGAMRVSRVAASAVCGRLGERRGFRSCLLIAGLFYTLAPALALLAPALPPTFAAGLPGSGVRLDLPLLVYLAALMLIGFAMQSSMIGGHGFLITSAPPHRRITYVGFLNTLTSPLTLLPLAGAWLAATVGIAALFACLIGGGAIYLAAVLGMQPARPGAPGASCPRGPGPP